MNARDQEDAAKLFKRAERNANTHFVCTLSDGVGDDAVQPDRGEQAGESHLERLRGRAVW